MSKTEITPEMVERGRKAFRMPSCDGHRNFSSWSAEIVTREILEAALNPPSPEPEIEVTQVQLDAGAAAYRRNTQGDVWLSNFGMRAAYIAMRKLEKPYKISSTMRIWGEGGKLLDCCHIRKNDVAAKRHRRIGD